MLQQQQLAQTLAALLGQPMGAGSGVEAAGLADPSFKVRPSFCDDAALQHCTALHYNGPQEVPTLLPCAVPLWQPTRHLTPLPLPSRLVAVKSCA